MRRGGVIPGDQQVAPTKYHADVGAVREPPFLIHKDRQDVGKSNIQNRRIRRSPAMVYRTTERPPTGCDTNRTAERPPTNTFPIPGGSSP